MAELLIAKGWPEPSSIAPLLRDLLSDDYIVVANPTLRGRELDAVVLGPAGLTVVYAKDWQAAIFPTQHGPWLGRLPSGDEMHLPNPSAETREAAKLLLAFLADEFPRLVVPIYHLVVVMPPEARLETLGLTDPPAVKPEAIAQAFARQPLPSDTAPFDTSQRELLAVALRDRRITSSERTQIPFVFRSGGRLGSGRKVWSIRDAVRHMDRHPKDAEFHLRNGTLANWLEAEGASHLASLAREVLHGRETDPRVMVERFLLGTGLVSHVRLRARPRSLRMGPVLSGETCTGHVELRRGPGRGYLFGTLRTSEPWLHVEPKEFSGGPVRLSLSADTEALPISRTPWQAEVVIDSSAAAVSVPVRVRVVGMPSSLNRRLLRPLAGALIAGALGAGLGLALDAWGPELPGRLAGRLPAWAPPRLAWVGAVGLLWALLGGALGALQPVAWPVSYAVVRWLRRALAWAAALALLAAAGLWSWSARGPELGLELAPPRLAPALLLITALAFLPAALAEARSARRAGRATAITPPARGRLRFARSSAFLSGLGLLIALALVLALPLAVRAWQGANVDDAISSARAWASARWTAFEAAIDGWLDRLTLRYSDRRATPVPTLAPTRVPKAAPTGGTP